MASIDRVQRKVVAGEVRRLSTTDKNRSFLRAMPLFGLDTALPDAMRDLLDRLDRVERESGQPSGR